MTPPTQPIHHTDVGAYALGVLDAADAARFEEHLAECERCAAELDALMDLPPLLAELAAPRREDVGEDGVWGDSVRGDGVRGDGVPGNGARENGAWENGVRGDGVREDGAGRRAARPVPDLEALTPAPGPGLLDGLLDEVAAARRTRHRRRLYLVAAAAALIVGGPLATAALTSGSGGEETPESLAGYARTVYEYGEKAGTVDPVTKVAASVAMEPRPWGTHVALKLGNVKGPLTCDLVAVGKNGAEQTVTTWAVPKGGYGLKDGAAKWNREPLYTHGGAAMNRRDIDHFEVRTLDGRRLAEVKV
ncbi:zf-HC2 domain-containing protein [Streptomyces sp. MST-110588]|uniref:anti-sigma factor family protein n=1 Tax=Streptomyces sp. MST-110588 TaxID=2833628 RepID=UPI001F5DDBBD|nr:zf-HC2 domain-containing protein [Streptomyces sp. MST-110588]UNO41765.1 zf-HC2 domain-containing protein [Streptomyces sp. MST-110588]